MTGALAWTGFSLDSAIGAGIDPAPCLHLNARIHADVGVSAWLFGMHADVSEKLFAYHIGSTSLPSSPSCD